MVVLYDGQNGTRVGVRFVTNAPSYFKFLFVCCILMPFETLWGLHKKQLFGKTQIIFGGNFCTNLHQPSNNAPKTICSCSTIF